MAVVLITGCSSGIGLATAAHLARSGWRVIATARRPEAALALAQLAQSDHPPAALLPLDVTDAASVHAAVRQARERVGPIDALVNNAGVGGGGAIEFLDLDEARAVMETNYLGALRVTQAVLPEMRRRGSGAIVNVSSVAGRVSLPTAAPYAASKFALEAASEALAQEVAPFGIRVALIEPGVVLTPIFTKRNAPGPDPDSPYWRAQRRLGRFFEQRLRSPTMPEQVAAVIERALTDEPPRLRYLVGPDAEALATARARVSDEEWVRLATIEDDEEYFDAMAELLGADLFR